MLSRKPVSRNAKVILYLLFLLTTTLLLYYGTWKMASSGSASNNLDATERQNARKKIMKEYCLTHSYEAKPARTRDNLGFIVVDDENKMIYCTIPKVSTTTWKTVLLDLRGVKTNKSVHQWHLWKRLYEYTEEEREIRLQTYFKFVFVREPLHRLLSAFKDKFIGYDLKVSRSDRNAIVKSYRPHDYDPSGENQVSFPEFIKYFSEDIYRNQHWRQYEKLCHPCVINYDFIGHLETLEEDAALLLKMAGIDDRVTFPPVHKSTRSFEVLEYFSQVPSEYINRIGELYRSDFEMFGYDFLGEVQPLLKNSSS